MNTVLDVIREVFKKDLSPELIGAMADQSTTPRERLREFSQRLRAFARDARAPDKSSDELRPYIPINHLTQYRANPTGIRLRYYGGDLDDPDFAESSFNAISLHLLYCHSVAIDNSLGFILDFFDEAWLEERRIQLVHYLHFLHMIKSLVEKGIVILIERPVDSGWNISETPHLPEGSRHEVAKSADLADFLDPADVADDTVRRSVMHAAENVVGHELVACHFHKNNIDLYCPFMHYILVLNKFVEQDNVVRTSSHDLKLLTDLVKLPIPSFRIESLDARDIVNIREDDAFSEFRLAVKRALERMASMGADFNQDAAQIRVLDEEMTEARTRLETTLQQSSFLTAARKGVKSFAIGALAGALVSAGPGVLAGATSAVLTVLWEYLAGRPTTAQGALMHHFLAMELNRP